MIKWKISCDFTRNCPVFYNVLQHQAWHLMTYAVVMFGRHVSATPPTAARGLGTPSGALLRGGSWSSSSVVWLTQCQGSRVSSCGASSHVSLLELFAQREVSRSRSITGSSGSILYPHLCLLHTVEVSNGLAWHHSTLGTVMERSEPGNIKVCRWFYSHE